MSSRKRPPKFNPENPYEDPPTNPFAAPGVLPVQPAAEPQKVEEVPAKVVPVEKVAAAIRALEAARVTKTKKAAIGFDILKASASDEDSVVHFTDHTFLVETMGYIESVHAAADTLVRLLRDIEEGS